MSDVRVYFEKQGTDRLCGVHCLNALVQGPVFTQADLNMYASELDKEESALLAADPSQAKPRQMTISSLSSEPKSNNQDWTGYFSLGVLEKALGKKYGISVQNAARRDIIQQINREGLDAHEGFVIHLRDHWFAARAINNPNYPGVREWYFLDSLKAAPMAVSENELWGTLQGIIQSGGNVFVLTGGKLPPISTKPGVLKSNQYWLSREEIKKRIAASESGQEPDSTTFTTVDPKKRKVETDWSQLGSGQTLTGEPQASRSDDIENEAIKQAIAESAKELSDPKPEPAANAPDVVTLLVRFPSGQRLTRRFSVDSTSTEDVFEWLEIAAAKAGTLLPAEYGLVGRGWRLNKKRGADLSLSLKSTGLAPGQEAVNLQL